MPQTKAQRAFAALGANRRVLMGSRKRSATVTKKGALLKVQNDLDGLSTLQANVLRMLYGLKGRISAPVGGPPEGCPAETVQQVEEIEEQVLEIIRGSKGVKRKIVDDLRSKS